MTRLDWKVYEFVKRYTEEHGHPPFGTSFIARELGYSQPAVWHSVKRWVEWGYMEKPKRYAAPVILLK